VEIRLAIIVLLLITFLAATKDAISDAYRFPRVLKAKRKQRKEKTIEHSAIIIFVRDKATRWINMFILGDGIQFIILRFIARFSHRIEDSALEATIASEILPLCI